MSEIVNIRNPYEELGTIEYNPDATVSGDDCIAHKSENHNHIRSDLAEPTPQYVADAYAGQGPDNDGNVLPDKHRYTVFGVIHHHKLWPWTEWSSLDDDYEDRDPEQMDIVNYPGLEYRTSEHVSGLFINTDDDPDTLREAVEQVRDETESHVPEEGVAFAYLAHPESYYEDPRLEWRRYRDLFEEFSDEEFVGLEIFGRRSAPLDQTVDVRLWDRFLTWFAPERLPVAFGVDDYGGSNFIIGNEFDRRYIRVFLRDDEFDPSDQEGSRKAARDAMVDGRSSITRLSAWDPETDDRPTEPKFTAIDVDQSAHTITLTTEDAETIEWVSKGEVVETGESIDLSTDHYPYVRARLESNPDGETYTQAFGIEVDADVEIQDAELNDASFGQQ